MTTITKLLSGLPTRTMSQEEFDAANEKLYADLPAWGGQVNALAANLNTIAAGGAYALPYSFGTTGNTGSAAGGRIAAGDYSNQSATAYFAIDLKDSRGASVAAQLAQAAASSSTIKGTARLVKATDPGKYIILNVTGWTTSTYHGIMAGAVVDSSSQNPFVSGDAVLLFFQRTGDRAENGFAFWVVISGTQTWTPPAGVTRAEITVIDGGQGCGISTSGYASPGKGGAASVSIITVSPSVTYTATVGAGGNAQAAGNVSGTTAGGASSFSGSGITTLTSSSGQLKVPGGDVLVNGSFALGGPSLYAPPSSVAPTGYGGGAPNVPANTTGIAGRAGAVIIRY